LPGWSGARQSHAPQAPGTVPRLGRLGDEERLADRLAGFDRAVGVGGFAEGEALTDQGAEGALEGGGEGALGQRALLGGGRRGGGDDGDPGGAGLLGVELADGAAGGAEGEVAAARAEAAAGGGADLAADAV